MFAPRAAKLNCPSLTWGAECAMTACGQLRLIQKLEIVSQTHINAKPFRSLVILLLLQTEGYESLRTSNSSRPRRCLRGHGSCPCPDGRLSNALTIAAPRQVLGERFLVLPLPPPPPPSPPLPPSGVHFVTLLVKVCDQSSRLLCEITRLSWSFLQLLSQDQRAVDDADESVCFVVIVFFFIIPLSASDVLLYAHRNKDLRQSDVYCVVFRT